MPRIGPLRLALFSLGLAFAAAGCSTLDGSAQSAARDDFARASHAQAEADRLKPTRDQQNVYAVRLRQAREALDRHDWTQASHASQLALEQASAFHDQKVAHGAEVATLISDAGAQVDDAQDHPDPRVDLPNFVYYVSNEIHAAQAAYDQLDYDTAEKSALRAHALIDKKAEFFTRPVSESIAVDPAQAAAATSPRSSGPVVCYWPSRSGYLAACSVVADRTEPSADEECKVHGFPRAISFGDAKGAFSWYDGHCCPRFRSQR